MVNVSISSVQQKGSYKLVVFREVGAAPTLVGSGEARPLALLMRLGYGRLIEIDLGLAKEGIETTEGDRSLLPPSSSALILTDTALAELDELLRAWDHVVYSLASQNRNDQE